MKQLAFVSSTLLLLCVACASSVELSEGAKKVKLGTAEPAANCEELGTVEGSGREVWPGDGTIASAENDLRNKAADMGANYVRVVDTLPENYSMSGAAYRCP